MKLLTRSLTSSLLLSFALLSNACGRDELDNHAKASSTLSSTNSISSVNRSEKREMANEFFQTVVSLAEESKMIDIWKMAIDKNLENPNKNLVDVDNKKVRRSIGLGFLSNTISLDFTYLSTKDYSRLIPYPIYSNQPVANISSLKNTFLISLGIK